MVPPRHPRPVYTKPPRDLGPQDLDREVLVDPEAYCARCDHAIQVARVVRLRGGGYGYACLGCALHLRPDAAAEGPAR